MNRIYKRIYEMLKFVVCSTFLVSRQRDRETDKQLYREIDRQIHIQIDREITEMQSDREIHTNRLIDRKTERQVERRTDNETDRQRDRQIIDRQVNGNTDRETTD